MANFDAKPEFLKARSFIQTAMPIKAQNPIELIDIIFAHDKLAFHKVQKFVGVHKYLCWRLSHLLLELLMDLTP